MTRVHDRHMTTKTGTQTLTADAFDRMEQDDRFLGFGYIGGRRNALDSTDPEAPAQPEQVAAADALVLDMAQGMTYDELFTWANSKDGRWFADCMFGGNDLASEWSPVPMARRYGPRA